MNTRTLLSVALASLAVGSIASAAMYTTDFGAGYTANSDLDGQVGWSTDPSGPGDVAYLQDSTSSGWGVAYGNVASIGFVTGAGQQVSYVSHAVSSPMVYGAPTTFSVDLRIVDSTNAAPDRDVFGFRLENASGQNLFSVVLTATDDPSPGTTTRLDTVSWTSIGGSGTSIWSLPEGPIHSIDVSFGASTGGNVAFYGTINNSPSYTFNGVLTGLATETITEAGAFWDQGGAPLDLDNGDNYMQFDNFSVVPEPSSAMLVLFGAAAALRRRRN